MKTTLAFGRESAHRYYALGLGLAVVAMGAIVLLGWAVGSDMLKTVLPGLVTMKANTALGLALCGGAMALLARRNRTPQLQLTALALATVTVTLGLLTLSQYFCRWNLGIDELMVRDADDLIGTAGAGRMAPATAFCFALTGVALGMLAQPTFPRSRFPVVSAIAATLLVIGGSGTLGQLANGLFRLDFWNFSGMALHTALGFVSLGAGLIELVRSEQGITWALDAATSLGFIVAVSIMLGVAGVSWNYTYRLQQEGALVSHSSEVLREIENIRSGMAGRESNQRGYVILGDEHLLDQRIELTAGVRKDIGLLRQLILDDQVARQRLDRIEAIVKKRTAFGDQVIQVRRQGGFPAAQAMTATGVGTALTADFNRSISEMRDSEYALLVMRQKEVALTATSTFLLLPSGIFLSLTILSIAVFFLNAGLTEEKQTRDRLRASLKDVSELKYAMDEHAIVAITNPLGQITYVNDKFCEISRYSRTELIGQDHRIINSGHHPKAFFHYLWTTISSGQVWHGEVKNRTKQGAFYWVDTTIVPFLNEDGTPKQYVAIRTDITERKRAEESSRLLASIVNCSNDAIISKNLDSIVTSWNTGAERIFGYSPAEMLGQSMLRLIPPDRCSEEKEIIAKVRKGESVEHFETVRVAKDGRRLNISVTVSPIKDKEGRIVGASKVARDITEQKAALAGAAEKILELNAKLEQRVHERTAELQAANKELEAFSYSVSHDLRSPLRAVDGFSQAVIEDYAHLLPEQGQKDLHTIRAAAQRMGRLIDDLLAFSRLGRTPVNRRENDVNAMVRDVLKDLRDLQKDRKIEILLQELPACQADPALLHQVWVNLIANALKYTSNCPVAVIEIGSRAEHDKTVYYVRDNGAGFDMRYAQKLFGVFQRLHRLDEFEGTGVGLAIVHRVITRHGGQIWADAKPDCGATFHFTLNEDSTS